MNDIRSTSEQSVSEAMHRLMRNLHRRPSVHPHGRRGYNRLLRKIDGNDGASSRELAELMDVRPSTLTRLLDRLEADGMIRRYRDENDLRIVHIHLEDAGRAHLETAKSKTPDEDTFSDILSSDERNALIDLCNKLSDGLEQRTQVSCEPTNEPKADHRRKDGHPNRGDKRHAREADLQSEVE